MKVLFSWFMWNHQSAEQKNHQRTALWFMQFVCPALQFIPYEPRKKRHSFNNYSEIPPFYITRNRSRRYKGPIAKQFSKLKRKILPKCWLQTKRQTDHINHTPALLRNLAIILYNDKFFASSLQVLYNIRFFFVLGVLIQLNKFKILWNYLLKFIVLKEKFKSEAKRV